MAIVSDLSGNGALAERTTVVPNFHVIEPADVVNFSTFVWPGGHGSFNARAVTWGGGSVKLQIRLPDGVTWNDMGSDTSLTADGGGNFEQGPCTMRVLVTTATGVTAVVRGSEVH